MSRGSRWTFITVVLAVTAVFVSLGLWQLDRLGERRAQNRHTRARLARPPLELGRPAGGEPASASGTPGADREGTADGGDRALLDLPPDSLDGRRIVLRGRFDYAREVVLAPRSFEGTPGVYLLTPLVVGDSTAVPVLRGSMPAPDGFHAELGRARPAWAAGGGAGLEAAAGRAVAAEGGPTRGPTVTVRGVALLPPEVDAVARADTLRAAGRAHPVLPRLDLGRVADLLPWRVPAFYVRADSTTEEIPATKGVRVPVPVPPPRLDDGPHLMYAIQWFAFAAIGLVGGGIFLALRGRD